MNPFFIRRRINNKLILYLIDSDADISVFPFHLLYDNLKISEYNSKRERQAVIAIPVKVINEEMILVCENVSVILKSPVANMNWKYAILEYEIDKKHPEILMNNYKACRNKVNIIQKNSINDHHCENKNQRDECKIQKYTFKRNFLKNTKMCNGWA